MTRKHVKMMFEQSGYATAHAVLVSRKARQEFFVQLNQLRADKTRKDAAAAAATFENVQCPPMPEPAVFMQALG